MQTIAEHIDLVFLAASVRDSSPARDVQAILVGSDAAVVFTIRFDRDPAADGDGIRVAAGIQPFVLRRDEYGSLLDQPLHVRASGAATFHAIRSALAP